MFRVILFLTFSIGLILPLHTYSNNKLLEYEYTLNEIIDKIEKEESFSNKNSLNNELISLLYEALLTEGSFDYPFDSIKKIGVLKSPDNLIRLFTWNIPQAGGLQRYFGFLQVNDNENNSIYPLTDNRKNYDQPHIETGNADNWFGSLYYSLNKVEVSGKSYYTLLGADMNNMFSSKRIIEVLYLNESNEPIFGHPIFKVGDKVINRIIFEYSSRANMVLKWEEELNWIVFDHLSPIRPDYFKNFQFYVPDFSFDAFEFKEPYWVYLSDVDIRNSSRERPPMPDQEKEFEEPGFLYRSKENL